MQAGVRELCSCPPRGCGLGLTHWLSAYGCVCSLLPSDVAQLSLATVSVVEAQPVQKIRVGICWGAFSIMQRWAVTTLSLGR